MRRSSATAERSSSILRCSLRTSCRRPTRIEDLAQPIYAGHISVPDILGSSTSWLMTQAVIADKGEAEGAKILQAIEKNAGAHLTESGSACRSNSFVRVRWL